METEIKEAIGKIEEMTTHLTSFSKRLDDAEKQGKSVGEIKTALDQVTKETADALKKYQELDILQKRLDDIEKKIERAKFQQEEAGINHAEHKAAVRDWLRTVCGTSKPFSAETKAFLESMEYKTLTEGTSTAGGLFVDPETEGEILKNVVDIDPVRTVARITTLSSSDRYKGYRRTGTPTAYWETEIGTSTDSEGTWATLEIPVHPLTAKTPVSGDLLDDVRFIESEVTADAAEQFSYSEGVAFISGSGVHRPMGIVTNVGVDDTKYPAIVASTGANGTNAIQASDIPKMYTTLKSPYRANATWLFNSNSLYSILNLKDTTNQFLWQPGLQGGPPLLLYGRPFVVCESIANEGADTYPLYLGDFRMGYRIVDRSGIVLQNDPYTIWPRVYYKWRKRVGGQVVKAEAIKILKTT